VCGPMLWATVLSSRCAPLRLETPLQSAYLIEKLLQHNSGIRMRLNVRVSVPDIALMIYRSAQALDVVLASRTFVWGHDLCAALCPTARASLILELVS
jgi:hypothetical protein